MRENFSKSIQNILKFAKEQAVKFGHSYVGSEHLLLGILKDDNCKASQLLGTLGANFEEMRLLVKDMEKPSSGSMTMGHLPLTRRAERILRTTYSEAKKLGFDIANDTHLLLALSKEGEGLASEVLLTFSITDIKTRCVGKSGENSFDKIKLDFFRLCINITDS